MKSLGVVDLDEAADGPGDPQILDAMILVGERDATPVMEATQRIARLVEIMEAAAAAAELSRRASKAAAEAVEIGKLTVGEGNRGDMAINDWVAAMMSAYRNITGKEPATSVGGPNRPDEGIAGGPAHPLPRGGGQAIAIGIFRGRLAQPGAHSAEGRAVARLTTIWPFGRCPPTRVSRRHASKWRNIHETNQPAAPDALIALVRLLARETARECLGPTPAPPENQEHPRQDDRK